jgi:protein TonB
MLHGVLLGVIVFGPTGAPAGVAGSGPLSLFDVALLAPPNGSGQGAAEPPPDSGSEQKQEPQAPVEPEDARPLQVECPQKKEPQPTPKRRPERTQAQGAAVSGMQGEDGARRQSAGEMSDNPDGASGALAAPGAAAGDGRPFGFSLGEVSGKPKVVRSVQVAYPVEARKKGITGQVLVRFHLDANGTVSHLHIKNAEPPDIFDRNTLAALRQWRFQPASHNSRTVPVWVELPIEFELR